MAYIDLSNDAMVAVSSHWVSVGDASKAIARYAPLAGLRSLIERAHNGVFALTTKTTDAAPDIALAELKQRAAQTDQRHDRAIRGAIAILDAAAAAIDDEKQRSILAADRATLFPSGASITQRSYADEAGAALALKKKLDDDGKLRRRLARVKLVIEQTKGAALTVSVVELIEQQVSAGRELSEIEQQRRTLEGGAPMAKSKSQAASTMSRARTAWVRAVTLLVDAANELEELSDEDRRVIFGPLAKALEGVERPTEDGDDSEPTDGEPKKD